jgi:hypothetical protein
MATIYLANTNITWAMSGEHRKTLVKDQPLPKGVPEETVKAWLEEGLIRKGHEEDEHKPEPAAPAPIV